MTTKLWNIQTERVGDIIVVDNPNFLSLSRDSSPVQSNCHVNGILIWAVAVAYNCLSQSKLCTRLFGAESKCSKPKMEDKYKEEYFLEHQQCSGSGFLSISVKMMSRSLTIFFGHLAKWDLWLHSHCTMLTELDWAIQYNREESKNWFWATVLCRGAIRCGCVHTNKYEYILYVMGAYS